MVLMFRDRDMKKISFRSYKIFLKMISKKNSLASPSLYRRGHFAHLVSDFL